MTTFMVLAVFLDAHLDWELKCPLAVLIGVAWYPFEDDGVAVNQG